jgi:hypothetical protein
MPKTTLYFNSIPCLFILTWGRVSREEVTALAAFVFLKKPAHRMSFFLYTAQMRTLDSSLNCFHNGSAHFF